MYTMLVGRRIKVTYVTVNDNSKTVEGLCIAVWVNKAGNLKVLLENKPYAFYVSDSENSAKIELLEE